jgi:RNA polymerase sigma-70 factor (ECF subfamily)
VHAELATASQQRELAQRRTMPEKADISVLLPSLLPRLWRFVRRLARDQHDAEDLMQRACLRALERGHQLRPGTSALSWMFSIIHSVWLNEVRARRLRSRVGQRWTDELDDTLADTSSADPALNVLHQQIIDAVGRLPDAQRAVILLVAVEGLSYREAAATFEIPIGTIMSRLARARLTIGQSLDGRSSKKAKVWGTGRFGVVPHLARHFEI